ncbi:LCP family protein [[Clostridium] fimetarium]|uniref:Cell envelope-related function transcriptional attenuator common domain-containing protein n=1 Tax=[Clostridium] fimetarium TaxID=99656 RepID=A0A1I0ME71_9FIRM|nr:LCP family protein [[Clostridium] fimetarium]SEV86056.1 cell envelope-related function transcriptional attenuator common domain-containing protein [[Clostridium] fimetarium]
MSNTKLLSTRSSKLNQKNIKKKKRLRNRKIGFSLIAIQIIITIIFMLLLFHFNIVPDKYMIMIIVVLILITAYNVISQFTKAHMIGKLLSVILSIALLTSSFYIAKTTNMLDSITNTNPDNITVSVIVLSTDPAQNITDAKDYKFGCHSIIDKVNTDKAITQINEKVGSTINTSTYSEWKTLVNALNSKEVKAIILNEAYRSALQELYPDFSSTTRIIDTITIQNQNAPKAADKNVSTEPFSIYIAGNDEYGNKISSIGRNDVNIIATFNPKTKQALLVTTPRDYYITLDNLAGNTGLDKLTHAGNFGIEGSIAALQNLYNTDIDYYVKVNFTGAVGIVDALGGITVDSELAFTTCSDTAPIPYKFVVGANECNGEKALAFCRERQVLANGDNQRGRNQMIAIKAIFAKATSPAIITNYSAVLDSVSNMFATNIPTNAIAAMVKDTLSDSTTWNIQTYNVTGTGATKQCQLFGFYADVMIPDYSTVNNAIELMSKIKQGEAFDVDQYVNSQKEAASSATKAK